MKTITSTYELGLRSSDRVLVCMPHPDDETVFTAGIIQKLCQQKIYCKITTFTHGEASTLRYGLSDTNDLGITRAKELKTAVSILGCKQLEMLAYPDGGLKKIINKLTSHITKLANKNKITTLVTLEPDGIYGHPDHIALTRACQKASSNQDFKLLYATVSPNYSLPKSASKIAEKSTISPIKADFELKLSLQETIIKLKSLAVHATQFKFSLARLSTYAFFYKNNILTREYFTYAQ